MLGRETLAAGPVMKGAFARERLGLSRVLSASTSESLTRPFHPPGHARCIMLRCAADDAFFTTWRQDPAPEKRTTTRFPGLARTSPQPRRGLPAAPPLVASPPRPLIARSVLPGSSDVTLPTANHGIFMNAHFSAHLK